MKKIIITLIALLFLTTSCSSGLKSEELAKLSFHELKKVHPDMIAKLEKEGGLSHYQRINVNEVADKIEASKKEEREIIVVSSSNQCIYCWYLKPVLNELAKNYPDITVYMLDISNDNQFQGLQDRESQMEKLNTILYPEGDYQGTPHVFRLKDGQVIKDTLGFKHYDGVIKDLGLPEKSE